MDVAERALLDETVRDALGRAGPTADGDAVLAELGWFEMLEAEPRAAVEIVFTALGSTGAAATALDDVLASALGVAPRADLTVLLPGFAQWAPPGRIDGSQVHARGLATGRVARADGVLVVGTAGSERVLATVPAPLAEVTAVHGVDPDGGLYRVCVDAEPVAQARVDPGGWESAVAAGQRAVAHQIGGASRTMLALAREHALARVQFGRPIAEFQAVRHRLADALVAVEALDAALVAAWDEPNPFTAALAKAVAGRAARTVAAHCQQVLAGIGFTVDHAFHRFLKRTMALEGLFGSTDEIVVDLGRSLLATRTVPTLIEL